MDKLTLVSITPDADDADGDKLSVTITGRFAEPNNYDVPTKADSMAREAIELLHCIYFSEL